MPKKARVILTFNCEKDCDYCCNKYTSIIDKAIPIDRKDLEEELKDFHTIALTGGEPLLDLASTMAFVQRLRYGNPYRLIYLYTAKFEIASLWLLSLIDGVHFTLHEDTTKEEIESFEIIQRALKEHPSRSYRLYIHPGIKHSITIIPNVWSRIESKPWLKEGECELPEDETLFKVSETKGEKP